MDFAAALMKLITSARSFRRSNYGGKLPRYSDCRTVRRDLDHRWREFFGCEMEHSWPVSHNGLLGLGAFIQLLFARRSTN